MAHLRSTLNEQGFESYPETAFKANVGSGGWAGLGWVKGERDDKIGGKTFLLQIF